MDDLATSSRETDFLSWERGAARVTNFTSASAKGHTTLRIELQVSSPWELGDIMRNLAELRDVGAATPPRRKLAEQG